MKKLFCITLILIAIIGTTFAGGEGEGNGGGEPQVALVTDIGGIDDKSFNQGTWEGVQRYAQDHNLKGVTYVQSESDADYIPNLSTVSDEGYKLIVAPGFLFTDAIGEVSANYPDTNYLIIDSVVGDRDNVVSAVFSEEQGSFLVGVAAALAAQKQGFSKVGFIGGMDFDVIQRFESGFEAGVSAIDNNIEVLIEYAGSFTDTQIGQTIAAKLFDQGAGIIFSAAGATGNGAIKEAKDRVLRGENVWTIGVDRDQYLDGIYEGDKSVMLTSMVKRVDVAAYNIIQAEMDGAFPGGSVVKFDLSNGGVGIPKDNPNLSNDIVSEVATYEQSIISGDIVVPTLPIRLQ